ncbi:MAG: biotin/lipoyl-containing protein, partial [Halobacteriota archaeon]|nr:biotin/lipoyl-containing protein [Halobacteriota archaeon]
DGVNHEVIVEAVTDGKSQLREVKTVESGTSPAASDGNGVTAPMQGTILKINVNVGDEVSEGDVVAVLEAMKMENEIVTHFSGVVKAINVSTGDLVNADDVVIVIG